MTEELITTDNLSKDFLKSVLDAAFMETSYDEEGDLRAKDRVNCYILPSEDRKDRIRLLSIFAFKPEASPMQRFEFVNQVNYNYFWVRAVVGKNDRILFTYDIPVAGGITKKAFILMVKRFCSIPHDAVADYGKEIVF